MKADVKTLTKTESLLKVIEGLPRDKFNNPTGIRTTALAEATGVPIGSIQVLLTPLVKNGRLCVCKITVPGSPPQNEYRAGGGKAAPEFKPLDTRRAGIALGAASHRGGTAPRVPLSEPAKAPATPTFLKPQPAVGNTGSSRPDSSVIPAGARTVAAQATPKPAAGVRLKKEPTTPKASAGDAIQCGIDDDGTLLITIPEGVLELNPKQAQKLGHFMGATHGVWNPF